MRLLEIKIKEIKDQEKIMENLYQFYENLFSNDLPVSNKSISNHLKFISLPKKSIEQRELCEGELTKKELKDTLNKMLNNETPGKHLMKELFEIISPLLLSFKLDFLNQELNTSQKQAAIKLLENKNRDKKVH